MLIVVIAAVSAVAAALFSDASQAGRVAADGRVFAAAQRVSTSAGVVKGNLGITIVLVSAEQAGVQVEDDVEGAIDRVRSDLVQLDVHARALDLQLGGGSKHSDLAGLAHRVTAEALEDLANASDTPSVIAAEESARIAAVTALDDLEELALSTGMAAQGRIEAEQSRAGDAARVTSLTVALIVPAAATWGLWSTARRREERLAMRAKLDKNLALIRMRDDLIGSLSHQLRTPLTAITGYAQALLEMPDDHELTREGLTIIDGQTSELTRMIDDLVAIARLEDGSVEYYMQDVDPVREIESVLTATSAWRGRIRTTLSPSVVRIDRLRLRHILTNLLSNAIKHGGPSVVVKSAPVSGGYRIVVADNGPGLTAVKLQTVFEPYVHTPRDALVTGTLGLGLAVAKMLAEQMGCRLDYERVNDHTLFVLDVPLALEQERPVVEELLAAIA